jgi:hypothetical protein
MTSYDLLQTFSTHDMQFTRIMFQSYLALTLQRIHRAFSLLRIFWGRGLNRLLLNKVEALFIPMDDATHTTQDILLSLAHRSAAAHFAGERTYQQLLDAHVWWKSMHEDALGSVRGCID